MAHALQMEGMCRNTLTRERFGCYMKRFVILVGLLLGLSSAFGQSQVTVTNSFKSINAVIPDASNIGLDDTRNVTLPGLGSITDLKVNLTVAGGFNGDLYCYLRHESGIEGATILASVNVPEGVLAEGNLHARLLRAQIVGSRTSRPVQQHDKAALVTEVAIQIAVESAGHGKVHLEVRDRTQARQSHVARVVQADV